MKKFMKRCAVIAFVFAVLGCALGLIGSSIAGRRNISQVMENVTGGKVHIGSGSWWSWYEDAGSGILEEMAEAIGDEADYDIADASMFEKSVDIMKGDVDRYCPGSGIRKLEIEVGSCHLETMTSDDSSIYLEAENAYKFQGYVKGDTLYIKAAAGSGTNWTDIGERNITLYIPDDYYFEKVNIELGAGEICFDGLNAEKAYLEVGAGLIVLDGAQVQKMELSVAAGSIELTDMRITELEAEVEMGEFLADGILDGNAEVECSMGNIEMTLDGSEEEFNYRLSGSMGNISLGEDSMTGFSNEKKIDNLAGKKMELECSMGNIIIDFCD